MANNMQGNMDEQLDQLLKIIPKTGSMKQGGGVTDEEIDYGFLGQVTADKDKRALMESSKWIIDSGESISAQMKCFL